MKVNALDFYSRVITVSNNIVSFFIVNPTDFRYERCKKIIDGLKEVNEKLPDNNYKQDNWSMLTQAGSILFNLSTLIFDAKIERLNGPEYRNRKITITCSSSLFKRLRTVK